MILADTITEKVLQKAHFKPLEYPSALGWHTFDGIGEATPLLKVYVGLSKMPNKTEGETESYSP